MRRLNDPTGAWNAWSCPTRTQESNASLQNVRTAIAKIEPVAGTLI